LSPAGGRGFRVVCPALASLSFDSFAARKPQDAHSLGRYGQAEKNKPTTKNETG